MPLIVIQPAHENWQLGAQLGRFVDGEAVAQRVRHGGEHAISSPAIRPGDLHDLLEPDVGGLHRLVEDIKSGCAHASPFNAPAGNNSSRPPV
jgi:hypothetical protein